MRIVTLFARHGLKQYADAIEQLDAVFTRQLPTAEWDLVISDNALPEDYAERLGEGRIVLGSSNANWEFSAWDRARAYLGGRLESYDFVHLATSAFCARDTRHLDHLDAGSLAQVQGRGVALGHIDQLNEPVVLFGGSSQAWLRSSWIVMPTHVLRGLGSLVSVADSAQLFSGCVDAPFRVDAPLSENYQRFIHGYLTGATEGMCWHSAFPITADSLAHFEAKAMAIVNEHMLSVRLRAQGCAMVDLTWLATRERLAPGQSLGVIPPWDWQIAARSIVAKDVQSSMASSAVRAALVVGEVWAIRRSHGAKVARTRLLQAVKRDPWLLTHRPVLGAVRRYMRVEP